MDISRLGFCLSLNQTPIRTSSQLVEPGFKALPEGRKSGGRSHLQWQAVPEAEAMAEKPLLPDPVSRNSLLNGICRRPLIGEILQ